LAKSTIDIVPIFLLVSCNLCIKRSLRLSYIDSNKDLIIKELTEITKEVFDFNGKINFDPSKADGVYEKFLESKKMNNLQFQTETTLKSEVIKTYKYYIKFNENF
jgi:GDP-L-fucose synthase